MKNIVFIADPLEFFDPISETTFFFMKEIQKRKGKCFHVELKDLYLENGVVKAIAKQVLVTHKKNIFAYKVVKTENLNLEKVDAVFLRKDPPFDLAYLDHLSILEFLHGKTFMVNNPSGIKLANEKILTMHFKDYIANTLVSQNKDVIFKFIKKHKTAILKPVNLSGGREIVRVSAKDASLNSLMDILTKNGTRYIIAQEFIAEAVKGDKRILLLDGEVLGAFNRVPSKKDFRGNLHSGAKLAKTKLTKRDLEIIHIVKDSLDHLGLYFIGLDLLGDKLTEINSTSPMGIREINEIDNTQIEIKVIDWLEKELASGV
ncbi:MAG: glutathione synthase [bacterium]|nr:glutathione synthase [bacterium]MBU1917700.1 glutathione synthase [bacterium]